MTDPETTEKVDNKDGENSNNQIHSHKFNNFLGALLLKKKGATWPIIVSQQMSGMLPSSERRKEGSGKVLLAEIPIMCKCNPIYRYQHQMEEETHPHNHQLVPIPLLDSVSMFLALPWKSLFYPMEMVFESVTEGLLFA